MEKETQALVIVLLALVIAIGAYCLIYFQPKKSPKYTFRSYGFVQPQQPEAQKKDSLTVHFAFRLALSEHLSLKAFSTYL
jgi:hypothetical protein